MDAGGLMLQSVVLRVVLGLALALALVVFAAHPKIRKWEQRLGVTLLLATGLPFLLLGAVFHLDAVGILTDNVLHDLRPAFEFGLGWIGFVVGMRFEVRRLDRFPVGLGPAIVAQAVSPMVVTGIVGGLFLYGIGLTLDRELTLYSLLLAACAAASAPVSIAGLVFSYGQKVASLIEEITALDEVAALAVLALLAFIERPQVETAWVLPASAWFLLSLGLGTLLGVLVYLLVRGARNEAEEICFLMGGVALSAGVAGYLSLSIPVTCALAGALLTNLPLSDRAGLDALLISVERPLYLIFLLVVGASWYPWDWQGWALGLLFVLARFLGKLIGSFWAKRVGPPELPPTYALSVALFPQSPIAIVVIISAANFFPLDPTITHWIIHAVLLAGILTDIFAKLLPKPTIKLPLLPGATP
jgi:hypothetical protein